MVYVLYREKWPLTQPLAQRLTVNTARLLANTVSRRGPCSAHAACPLNPSTHCQGHNDSLRTERP